MKAAFFINDPGWPGIFTGQGCCSDKEVAPDAVFEYREGATTKSMW
jgi:hypothetical protein